MVVVSGQVGKEAGLLDYLITHSDLGHGALLRSP